jgi:hypothetical protein
MYAILQQQAKSVLFSHLLSDANLPDFPFYNSRLAFMLLYACTYISERISFACM